MSRAAFRRSTGRPWSHARSLAGLLLCTLALATMLAYAAHDAARSHRATAERALHDYAAVAAWELVAGVNDELRSSLDGVFGSITHTRAASPYELLSAPTVLVGSAADVLPCPGQAAPPPSRTYFRVDLRDGSIATAGAPPPPALRAWLLQTVAGQARTVYKPNWSFGVYIGGPSADTRTAIAYAVKYAEHSAPIAVYGFTTCPRTVDSAIVRSVLARRALLPASVTNGANNDSLLSITVSDLRGGVVFHSARTEPSPYAADAPLEQVGPLMVHAAIRPHAVERLALGSIPETRVPWLVGLLVLTAGMIVVTAMQLRREHDLARLRADFISSVSHELRTPLSQILLFAETLNLGRVRTDQERRDAADVIVQEARRLFHLVENILHFSRTERGMSRLDPEPLDLSRVVESIVEDWRPLATSADVRLHTAFAADVHAMADGSALRQIVLNLLDNAVKYGPQAQTVTVGTGAVRTPSGPRARVWVDDEGEGIPPRERERVWESFYRMKQHASSSVAGSGIGLYVVRELARAQGGDAWVEDGAGRGARIVVELPVAPRAPGFTDEHPLAPEGAAPPPVGAAGAGQ